VGLKWIIFEWLTKYFKVIQKAQETRGRAMAHAVIRQLPTAAARIQALVRACGICGGQNGNRAGFLRVLRFPLPILIPPTAPHSSSIIRGLYNRRNNVRRTKWTQSHRTPKNKRRGTAKIETDGRYRE
jgi:hypothetical protein